MIGALYKANVEGYCIVFKHMNAIMTLYGLLTTKSNLAIAKSSIGDQRSQVFKKMSPLTSECKYLPGFCAVMQKFKQTFWQEAEVLKKYCFSLQPSALD